MSLAQFPSFATPNLPRTSPPTTQSQMTPPTSASGHRACCENGRPILTDPHTGQTVCSCQYPPGLVSYPRPTLPPGLESVYSASAYAAAVSQGYVALGAEGSAFYTPLGTTPYDLKESAEAWRALAASQPGFPYDPMAMYPYGPGKNATRENTNTLKAWLYEHRKNPYPTKGEKIMLAIITKMTLTQVSTWFANARRRLKKENKMTWSPRNRSEDGSDDVDNNDDDDDENRGRDAVSPHRELDITSSKPSSPLLSPGSDRSCENPGRPFKERIIRVDDDEDDCDDDDDDETSRDSFHRRRLLSEFPEGARHHYPPSRDRSPLRPSSRSELRGSFTDRDSNTQNDVSRTSSATGDAVSDRRSPSTSSRLEDTTATSTATGLASASKSPNSPSQSPSEGSTSGTPIPSKTSPSDTPPSTRPKIWSISEFIKTTSSSSSSSASSPSTSSSAHLSHSTNPSMSTLPSPSILARHGFMTPPNSGHGSSPQRPIPNQGFLFLPPGAAAHWPAAAARFAGLGGAYPLSLTHSTLSYPYNLTAPGVTRAGLEAVQAQAAQLARAAAAAGEGGGRSEGGASHGDKLSGLPHPFPRLPASALFSQARDLDGIKSQVMPPSPRVIVDSSI